MSPALSLLGAAPPCSSLNKLGAANSPGPCGFSGFGNLDNGRLSVGAVAARHRVTPRYVQLLFEREGTTFSEYVLNKRLARAHRMLADPRYVTWTVTDVALEAGFGDVSYFNRRFRRRYGARPTDVRYG